jgi:hypothetical protein
MKTALALVAIAVAGVASSPAYGLSDAGALPPVCAMLSTNVLLL